MSNLSSSPNWKPTLLGFLVGMLLTALAGPWVGSLAERQRKEPPTLRLFEESTDGKLADGLSSVKQWTEGGRSVPPLRDVPMAAREYKSEGYVLLNNTGDPLETELLGIWRIMEARQCEPSCQDLASRLTFFSNHLVVCHYPHTQDGLCPIRIGNCALLRQDGVLSIKVTFCMNVGVYRFVPYVDWYPGELLGGIVLGYDATRKRRTLTAVGGIGEHPHEVKYLQETEAPAVDFELDLLKRRWQQGLTRIQQGQPTQAKPRP